VGGLDCCGIACGEEIKTRAFAELSETMDAARAKEICNPNFEINDCDMQWWTGKVRVENESVGKLLQRCCYFMCWANICRCNPSPRVISIVVYTSLSTSFCLTTVIPPSMWVILCSSVSSAVEWLVR
jgi:hypothetical protein